MSHSFKIALKEEFSSILEEVESAIVKSGGEFKGDTHKGKFAGKTMLGKIKGEYACLSDDEIEITITKKPLVAAKNKIESAIREYFS